MINADTLLLISTSTGSSPVSQPTLVETPVTVVSSDALKPLDKLSHMVSTPTPKPVSSLWVSTLGSLSSVFRLHMSLSSKFLTTGPMMSTDQSLTAKKREQAPLRKRLMMSSRRMPSFENKRV